MMRKKFAVLAFLLAAVLCCFVGCSKENVEENPVVSLNVSSVQLGAGETVSLTAESTVDDLVWGVTDETVALVESDGKTAVLSALSEGTTTLYVYYAKDESVRAECSVTVTASKLTVNLPQGMLVLRSKVTARVKAFASDGLTGEAVWTSSDTSVATVEYQGLVAAVTSVSRGECKITVTYGGASCSFTVIVGV